MSAVIANAAGSGSAVAPHVLQCAEVWGGIDPVDRGVVMVGLDAWVYAEPTDASDAGGDIHYLTSCATGRITRMMVADVAGHGAGVAPIARNLRTLVRRFMNYVDQSRLVEGLNQEFAELTKDGRFATAIIGTYWGPTGMLDLTCAGHPPPLMFFARTGKWSLIQTQTEQQGGDIPLGIVEGSSYAVFKTQLRAGDMVMLYSDALIEAKSANGELLTLAGLVDVVNSVPQNDAGAMPRLILKAISERGFAIDDDVTMLLIRPNSLKAKVSLSSSIAAMWRITRGVVTSIIDGKPGGLPECRKDSILGAVFDRFNRQ